MTNTIQIDEIRKLLDSTTLSDIEKQDFIIRLQEAKEWTPELAEEFGEAILSCLKTYEADLAVYTATLESKQNEMNHLEENWQKESEALLQQKYADFQRTKEQTDKAIAVADKQIDKYILDTQVGDLGSLLGNIYK